MSANSPLLPSAVKQHPRLFDDFISKAHLVTMTIMGSLSNALHANANNRLEQHHRDQADSNTTLVLLRYPKDVSSSCVGHNQHTDICNLSVPKHRNGSGLLRGPATQSSMWAIRCASWLTRSWHRACIALFLPQVPQPSIVTLLLTSCDRKTTLNIRILRAILSPRRDGMMPSMRRLRIATRSRRQTVS
jgi:hypothetical protein